MKAQIDKLQQEIARLKEELSDREAALPAHSVRPHQIMVIEELEEEIKRKENELRSLENAA